MASRGITVVGDPDMSDQDMVDPVPLVVNHMVPDAPAEEAESSGERPAKRPRTDSDLEISMDMSVKKLLFNVNTAICLRLEAIETKLDTLVSRTQTLEERLDQLCEQQDNSVLESTPNSQLKKKYNPDSPTQENMTYVPTFPKQKNGTVVVGVPSSSQKENLSLEGVGGGLGPNITLITLNNEEDFPNGSWLGDESNPEMRVRVPVTPSDLLHIHSNCRSPEKMALTLLDYLFDRETQACSNLSGMSKHGKKQLDPLMIYGIRCHLINKFGINEQDWHRIKQNMDSKCRTAFRRRSRGLPLTVKAFRGKAPPTYVQKLTSGGMGLISGHDLGNQSDNSLSDSSELQIHQGDVDLQQGLIQAQADGGLSGLGEIQVLHATPEQIAQLHQGHQIQILQGDNNTHIIQLSNSSSSAFSAANMQNLSGSNLSASGANVQNVQVTEIPISLPSGEPNAITVPTGETEDVSVKNDSGLNHEDLVSEVSQE